MIRDLAALVCWADLIAAVVIALLAAATPWVSPWLAATCLGLALICRGAIAIAGEAKGGEDQPR